MRQIIKTVGKEQEVIDTCESLEEALEILELLRSQSDDNVTFHIGYEDVNLNLEEWEVDWVKACLKEDRKNRKALAEQRANNSIVLEEEEEDYDYDLDELEAEYMWGQDYTINEEVEEGLNFLPLVLE